MAIILKNALNEDVRYDTSPSVGSGTIKANGGTVSVEGATRVSWKRGGNSSYFSFPVNDNKVYTMEVSEKGL
ncbi:hypothetical protein ACFO3O_09370 [Dokdonia ponticola]|uniref:Uncharacterized protein n=1 Tax=Dokdonia ponticola TaxID=2041041 RepID=A0ABV9HXV4_9FLAO